MSVMCLCFVLCLCGVCGICRECDVFGMCVLYLFLMNVCEWMWCVDMICICYMMCVRVSVEFVRCVCGAIVVSSIKISTSHHHHSQSEVARKQ